MVSPRKKTKFGALAAGLLFWVIVGSLIIKMAEPYEPRPSRPKKELTRAEKISGQFSDHDGRHFVLARVVKANLKDPSSFEHLETSFKESGAYLTVSMVYRARNSFGALVIGYISAKVSIKKGNILVIL